MARCIAASRPGGRRARGLALFRLVLWGAAMAAALALSTRNPWAQSAEPVTPLFSLKTVPVPGPSPAVLSEYIQSKTAAIQLGKALFWEMRVGSDNKTACATCHFHAGADRRVKNQLSPGLLAGDRTFQVGGVNYAFKATDFPLTKPVSLDQAQPLLSDANDVAGSQGVFSASFNKTGQGGAADDCADVADDVFHGGAGNAVNTRQVTGRNAPTVINAVFNFRNFWDGRANNTFNGGDPFGMRNQYAGAATALVWKQEAGQVRRIAVAIPSASLASQADGPPLSAVEMSCAGRSFVRLGTKLLGLQPLAGQAIAPDDSVLAPLLKKGKLTGTYADLVKAAFRPAYWGSSKAIDLSGADAQKVGSMDLLVRNPSKIDTSKFQVSQMEANFALFFGLALQMYESTLIADDTPFDRWLEGKTSALTVQQSRGLQIFAGVGRCLNCHRGPELTGASFSNVTLQRLERMVTDNVVTPVIYDNGFYNIGVRPTWEDLGVGGKDPFGNPLSETRMAQAGLFQWLGNDFTAGSEPWVGPTQRIVADGAFKTPGLRNVEFTGPYFHNGGKATLMQVVDFYNRGGDFPSENRDNLSPDITPLFLSDGQKEDLVAFLLALSDDRVRYSKAPFDHPALCVPQGHPVDASGTPLRDGATQHATDAMECLPAVGAGGTSTGLATFLGLSPYQH